MKRGAHDHPKMLRLARTLGITRGLAVMRIELLLHWMEKYAVQGDLGRFDDADIAAAAEWPTDGDEPRRFVEALVSCRWVDISDEHRLIFHGWSKHCDRYVHIKLVRKSLLFADGTIPNRAGVSKKERERDGLDLFLDEAEQERKAAIEGVQQPLIPEEPACAHNVRTVGALSPPPPPPHPQDQERDPDARARARGFGPGEETTAPAELGEGERALIRAWAINHAGSLVPELVQLEQLCLAYWRPKKKSSDWVSEVQAFVLRILRERASPPRGSRPPADVRAVSREKRDRAELDSERRKKQLEEWQREKAEDPPEFLRKAARHRPAVISLDAWVDRQVASA